MAVDFRKIGGGTNGGSKKIKCYYNSNVFKKIDLQLLKQYIYLQQLFRRLRGNFNRFSDTVAAFFPATKKFACVFIGKDGE